MPPPRALRSQRADPCSPVVSNSSHRTDPVRRTMSSRKRDIHVSSVMNDTTAVEEEMQILPLKRKTTRDLLDENSLLTTFSDDETSEVYSSADSDEELEVESKFLSEDAVACRFGIVVEGTIRKHGVRTYFKKLFKDDICYEVGDCVYLSSPTEDPYIARIRDIYIVKNADSTLHAWITSRWYYKQEDVTAVDGGYFEMVNQHEVYWSSTENSNSARSIDGRCSVYLCPVDHDDDRFADLCFKAEEDQYFCRFAYDCEIETRTLIRFSDPSPFDNEQESIGSFHIHPSFSDELASIMTRSGRRPSEMSSRELHASESSSSVSSLLSPGDTVLDVYEKARQSLHISAVPTHLPCRDDEKLSIREFLVSALEQNLGAVMYISGMPGTGKTASVHEELRELRKRQERAMITPFRFLEINGMKISDPLQVYTILYHTFTGRRVSPQHALPLLEKYFSSRSASRVTCVLLLDEMDEIALKNQSLLYNILDWPRRGVARLIVIGIANTFDLMDRQLPRLVSRSDIIRLSFQPYNHNQIQKIDLAAFDRRSIELCARKVASSSGDVRRALEICRHAVEIAELSARETHTLEMPFSASFSIRIEVVDRAMEEVYSDTAVRSVRSLPRYVRIGLCACISTVRRCGTRQVDVSRIVQRMGDLCRLGKFEIPSDSATLKILNELWSRNLVEFYDPHHAYATPISLLHVASPVLEESTLAFALRGDPLVEHL